MPVRIHFNRKSVHSDIYWASLCLYVISLSASRYFITISLIILIANWLAEGGLREKFRIFFSNKPAMAFTLIYAMNVVGLLWSSDLDYALRNDLLHKSPTLLLPLILVTSARPDVKRLWWILIFFISSVVVVTLIGFSIRIINPNLSYREASPFMPGIYLAIMVLLAAFQLPLLIRQVSGSKAWLIAGMALSVWLIFFLFYLRSLSGIASLAGVALLLLVLLARSRWGRLLKVAVIATFTVAAVLISRPLIDIYRLTHAEVETDFSMMGESTAYDNSYTFDTTNILRENGHLVYAFISETELRDAWNERSDLDFYGNDLSGNPLNHTLYRFLSSKGLRKDRHDLMLLTDTDIDAVEKGITNYLNIGRPGFYVRVYEEMMGLYLYRTSRYKGASWSSSSQRLDLWGASFEAFRKHPLLGWGTGGILPAMDYGFTSNGSVLQGLNMKPHNQYICILLSHGITGMLLFMALYIYVVVRTGAWRILMFKIFLVAFAVNFLVNNSLESQMGQSIFVFFSLWYCFLHPQPATDQG